MTPIKILHKNPVCSFNSDWLVDIINQYLEFEIWDPGKTYAQGTLFYLNLTDFVDSAAYSFSQQLAEQGFRVIIDNLWEVNPGPVPNTHRVLCERWFWYNESRWYKWLGYHKYQPQHDYQYLALMPMNRSKPHRNNFVDTMRPLLHKMLWSYVEHGRQLPNDLDMKEMNTQRYMNPSWYDQTYCSLVVESAVRPVSKYTPIFITEKTMKPLAYRHPFIVYGNRGTLRTLRNWGFVTFENLWDESYDEIVDVTQRKNAVVSLIGSLESTTHDAETVQRLEHNHQHFFDSELVQQGIVKEILEPIIEYAETR